MRILISADLEGASGVVSEKETGESEIDYHRARQSLTADINAAIEGGLAGGATHFVIHDTHGLDFRTVLMDELHPSAEVVRGQPVIFYQLEDLQREGYAAAFLIGMHAGAGAKGILSHVLDDTRIKRVRVNGEDATESHITIGLAAHFGIPTVLITGDDLVCQQLQTWTGEHLQVAVVKTSLSRYAARCLPLQAARERIRAAAETAIAAISGAPVRNFTLPAILEVDFDARQTASYAAFIPRTEWDGDVCVRYTAESSLELYRALLAMFWIAESRITPGGTAFS